MAEFQLSGLLADLVHWEIHDPAELISLCVHMARHKSAGHLKHDACGFLRFALFPRGDEDQCVVLQRKSFPQLRFLPGEEFGDAPGHSAVLVHAQPIGFASGLDLHICAELVNLLTGERAACHRHGFDRPTFEGFEAQPLRELRYVFDRQVDAQIRLVGAVGLHGVVIGNTAKWGVGSHIIGAVFREDRRQHVLQHGEHVLLRGEGHLHVQLIKLAG